LQILLFPEGTDLTAGSQQRSHQFASAHQLERYYQVLHPKTTGFVFLVQRMRQSEDFHLNLFPVLKNSFINENFLIAEKYISSKFILYPIYKFLLTSKSEWGLLHKALQNITIKHSKML
jgi:hypothetical protein